MKTFTEEDVYKMKVSFLEANIIDGKLNPINFRASSDISTVVNFSRDESSDRDLIIYKWAFDGNELYFADNIDHIAYMILQYKEYFNGEFAEGDKIKNLPPELTF